MLFRSYLPLLFFFNRNPGLYLPLIALQYHEVRIDLNLSPYYTDYFGANVPEVWANYMYLDTAERERFAKNNHEYLIEQVQHVAGDPVGTSSENAPSVIRLAFNHPVKELIWCYQDPSPITNRNAMWNFSTSVSNVNVTVDPAVLVGSYTGFGTNYVGCPILYTPGPYLSNLTVLAKTDAIVSASTIIAGASISARSNILGEIGRAHV